MEPATNSHKRQLITTLAVLIVVVAIVAAVAVTNKKKPAMTETSSVTPSPSSTVNSSKATTPATSSTTTSSSTYKDGTYTATGSYDSPGGTESISISVTLANDVVTATSATSGANDSEAREYQSMFINNYKQQVVGKKISDISLSRVSGSSLTSQGFNSAVQKIEAQAKA